MRSCQKRRWGWPVIAILVALGCFGSHTLKPEDLAREVRQLRSLDAESQLLEEVVAAHHRKSRFAFEHASYLQRTAHAHAQRLARARLEPGAEAELERVRGDATRLEDRLVALILEMQ